MHACLKAYISLTAIHECINVGIIGGLLTDNFCKLPGEAAAPYIGVEKIIPLYTIQTRVCVIEFSGTAQYT